MSTKNSELIAAVLNYTPCRVTECYFDEERYVEIPSPNGFFRLNGVGRDIWLLCDGQTTIDSMIRNIIKKWNLDKDDDQELRDHVVRLIKNLSDRYVLVANWDPIYKAEMSQEFYL